jgi:N-acetylglucosamine kinase-like BadF-type ATPase
LGSHQLGLKALQAICLAHQGMAEPTSLAALACDSLQLSSAEALLYAVTQRNTEGRLSLGRLTPLLFDAAEAGDPVSREIVEQHGKGLGQVAVVAARHVGITGQAMKVALTGGVFRHSSSLLSMAILDSLRASVPLIEPVTPFGEPVLGSLIDALRRIDVAATPAVLANLCRSVPSADYFDTIT